MTESAKGVELISSSLVSLGYSVRLRGFSAIDRYMGLPDLPFLEIETNADIAVLARFIENLRFPGANIADGAADTIDGTCYFHCIDDEVPKAEQDYYSFPLLSFSYDWQRKRFLDPLGVYPKLRALRDKQDYSFDENLWRSKTWQPKFGRYRAIMDAAMFVARYGSDTLSQKQAATGAAKHTIGALENCRSEATPSPEMQRVFLICLLVSPHPELGLGLLKHSGFLAELWPELAAFDDVDHSKEFHPEGNVWNHTLETFRYRKSAASGAFDLRLSLALLLHDAGKPISASFGNHRFEGHAELGARAAEKFLGRLGFSPSITQEIFYLVRNHMLPAALKRLPLVKTAEIMASPIFPTLMELYRCDESSSFKGLDGYYENSAAYQTYLKNLRNPYRTPDGKKLGKKQLHSIIN